MRYISFFIFTFSITLQAQEVWSDRARVLPNILRKVPVGVMVTHTPNPTYPEKTSDKNPPAKYVWKHSTTVFSPEKDLSIVEAGSFIWYDNSGWKKNMQFNRRTFTNKFNCPNGLMLAGKAYIFEENYRWGDQLYGGDALWYVLAEDEDGELFKGIGIIETESTLQNIKP